MSDQKESDGRENQEMLGDMDDEAIRTRAFDKVIMSFGGGLLSHRTATPADIANLA